MATCEYTFFLWGVCYVLVTVSIWTVWIASVISYCRCCCNFFLSYSGVNEWHCSCCAWLKIMASTNIKSVITVVRWWWWWSGWGRWLYCQTHQHFKFNPISFAQIYRRYLGKHHVVKAIMKFFEQNFPHNFFFFCYFLHRRIFISSIWVYTPMGLFSSYIQTLFTFSIWCVYTAANTHAPPFAEQKKINHQLFIVKYQKQWATLDRVDRPRCETT